MRGLIEDGRCRICFSQGETVEYLVAGCRVLANSEYLTKHNCALMILAVVQAKENELIGKIQYGTKKGGSEVQYWKMKQPNWYGISNLTYER